VDAGCCLFGGGGVKREVLLAEARKHVWAAWQLSSEELAAQAVVTLHDMGMLVPEGTAPQLEKLAEQVVALQTEVAEAVRAASVAVRERDLMRERVSEPFGCAHCGAAKRVHGRRYIGGVGMHGWERPSDEQVKDRMLARRAASMALPSNLSLWEEPAATKALRARVAELEAAAKEIQRLHTDSPMGPCPVCIDGDAMVRGDDYTLPYPCPTARLAGAKDCDPPSQRQASHLPAEGGDAR
jgi:hypothetical protein